MLQHNCTAAIPLSSPSQLATTLECLQGYCGTPRYDPVQYDKRAIQQEIARQCVRGFPLSKKQAEVVVNSSAGLANLARMAESAQGQARLCEALGAVDGGRVSSYFQCGPQPL